MAADGSSEQSHDDLRRADLPREDRGCAAAQGHRRAVHGVQALPPAPGGNARNVVLGGGRPLRHRSPRRTHGAAGACGQGGAAGVRVAADVDATRPVAAALAVPSRRQLRGRQRAGRAHPSLLRRRHRARARDAVDDRRHGRRAAGDAVRAARAQGSRCRRCAGATDGAAVGRAGIRAQDRRHAGREGRRDLARPREGRRAGRQGVGAHRGNREAGADGAGLADALQGHARRHQARRVGRPVAVTRSEDHRQGVGRLGQRRAAARASPVRCAAISSPKANRSMA